MYHTKKRIKGKHYWYLQRSRRIGKRVGKTLKPKAGTLVRSAQRFR